MSFPLLRQISCHIKAFPPLPFSLPSPEQTAHFCVRMPLSEARLGSGRRPKAPFQAASDAAAGSEHGDMTSSATAKVSGLTGWAALA
eukprot:365930-Chlamydomonas_euryale.AAC.33